MLSSSHGKTSLVSIISAVLSGITFLGMAIGALWIWIKKRRTKDQTGGTEGSKTELSTANTGHSSPWHREGIHETHGSIKSTPELPAPVRHELTGDDDAREMPTFN